MRWSDYYCKVILRFLLTENLGSLSPRYLPSLEHFLSDYIAKVVTKMLKYGCVLPELCGLKKLNLYVMFLEGLTYFLKV